MGFSPGAGTGSISGSTDVALNSPKSDDVFTFDASIAKWRNKSEQSTIVATGSRFPGIYIDDLSQDSSIGFVAALAAVPDGGTLIIPAGSYRYDATLFTVTDKSVRFSAYGAYFLKHWKNESDNSNTTGAVLDASYGMEPTIKVSPTSDSSGYQITPSTYTTYSSSGGVVSVNPSVKIKLDTVPSNWRRGEIIKIFAFDINLDARVETDDHFASRSGQQLEFIELDSSDNTNRTIICMGVLRDTYLLQPRVAKYSMNTIHWEGGTFGITDDVFTDGLAASQAMRIQSAHMPVIKDVNIRRQNAICLQVVDCISPLIDNVDVRFARNDPVQLPANPDSTHPLTNRYRLGYGVFNGQSENMVVRNCHFADCRHGYTDDSYSIAATLIEAQNISSPNTPYSPVYKYGRAFNTKVVDSTAINCTAAAWNTHHGGDQTLFSNCTAIASKTAFGARSKNFIIEGGSVIDCTRAITTYNDSDNDRGGKTYNFVVNGLNVNGVDEVMMHDPNLGTAGRDPQMSYMRNVHATNIRARVLGVRTGSLQVENSYFELAPNFVAANVNGLITVQNGLLRMDNSHISTEFIDPLGSSSSLAKPLIYMTSEASEVQMNNMRVSNVTGQFSSILQNTNTSTRAFIDIKMDYLPAMAAGLYLPATISTESWIKAQGQRDGRSNANFTADATNFTNGNTALAIALSAWDIINVEVNIASAQTLGPSLYLPTRRGQTIYLTNTGSAAFTIPQQAKFTPITNDDQTVTANKTITMFIDSSRNYRQRGPIT